MLGVLGEVELELREIVIREQEATQSVNGLRQSYRFLYLVDLYGIFILGLVILPRSQYEGMVEIAKIIQVLLNQTYDCILGLPFYVLQGLFHIGGADAQIE
jgi:hypothetical protein